MERTSGKRLTKKRIEKYKEQFALESMEIAGLAQALIKRRIERALKNERELDELMNELLRHAECCDDRSRSKAIIAKFDALRIEDLTKLSSVLKSMNEKEMTVKESAGERQIKFEDI